MKFACITAALLPAVYGCGHANVARQADSNASLPFTYTPGDDPPADPATKSYFINHVNLLVNNITASRQWYSDVFGMRHVFTFDLSPEYSIMYMAHSQGGRNGSGYQTGAEMIRDKNNMAGMMEFVSYTVRPATAGSYIRAGLDFNGAKKTVNRTYTPGARTTFSHIGLIVEDLDKAQARFEDLGVNIIKKRGALDVSAETGNRAFLGGWGFLDLNSEETQADIAAILPGMEVMGFRDFAVIVDLDGNLIEVQQQESVAV